MYTHWGMTQTRRYNYGKGMEPVTASETHEQSLGGPNNPTYHYGEEFVKVLLSSHWGGQQPGGTIMVCAMKDVGKCNPSRVTQGMCQNIPETSVNKN